MRVLDDIGSVLEATLAPDDRLIVLGHTFADVPDVRLKLIVTLLERVCLVAGMLLELEREAVANLLESVGSVDDSVDVGVLTLSCLIAQQIAVPLFDPRAQILLERITDDVSP